LAYILLRLNYLTYGSPFPVQWARNLPRHGIAPQIAMEPGSGMDTVRDDGYLRKFARDAASVEGPVFLRFASEMNGDWAPYHGDPPLYRAAFRLVHDVMAEDAPNVAMVWCVNHIPHENIAAYYPGDRYVDWVGVNFYSVLHHDNDPRRPAMYEHPASLLQFVYDRYADRKPIAICEYGASHQESLDGGRDHSDIAAAKLAEMLTELPLRFPRVKMIGLYDSDNLTARFVRPGRRLNNYSITDSPRVLRAVTQAAMNDYFLPSVATDRDRPDLPEQAVRLRPGAALSAPVRLVVLAASYDLSPTVMLSIDGREAAHATGAGAHRFNMTKQQLTPGKHILRVDVLDARGRRAGAMLTPVMVE
jgi:hypothetical protein